MKFIENERTELKRELTDAIKKEIIAFANTEGGTIYIGVDDDGITYENIRSFNQELTFDYAEKFFRERNLSFDQANQRTLSIINEDGFYTNLGLLLPDQCEHTIKCGVYKGCNKLEFQNRKEFSGSLFAQLDDAHAFINQYNHLGATFEGLYRIDLLNYPHFAIREALINAVVHKDYSFNSSIIVHILDDRMEFISVGGLVPGISELDIKRGVSISRNPKLAACFYRLELIESYGTGIKKIVESYGDFERRPHFEISPNAFLVTIKNRNFKDEPKKNPVIYQQNKNSNGLIRESYSNQEEILRLLQIYGKLDRKTLEKELNISKTNVTNLLNRLIAEGEIVQEGNARATRYALKNK